VTKKFLHSLPSAHGLLLTCENLGLIINHEICLLSEEKCGTDETFPFKNGLEILKIFHGDQVVCSFVH
jgi:hypothetical protein